LQFARDWRDGVRIVGSFEVVDNFTGRTSFAFQGLPDSDNRIRAKQGTPARERR